MGAADTEAFRWTKQEGMQGLGRLPGVEAHSFAHAASHDGGVIVGNCGDEVFRWTEEDGMQPVGLGPFLAATRALDVSADGNIIVGWGKEPYGQGGRVASIWDEQHGMRVLSDVLEQDYGVEMEGWYLARATGISADGSTIVGYGGLAGTAGGWDAWLVHLPRHSPEPTALVLLGMGMLSVFGRNRRR